MTLDYGIAPPAPITALFTPRNGSAGTIVSIAGRFFIGVKSVTLNGQAMPFRPMSSSIIDFEVPQGAASGAISVTTGAGTATSTGTFTVR